MAEDWAYYYASDVHMVILYLVLIIAARYSHGTCRCLYMGTYR